MILLMILITENKRQVATVAYPAAPEQFSANGHSNLLM
jgi:hypothetical protein